MSQLSAYLHSPAGGLPCCSLRFSCFNGAPIVIRSCRTIVGRLRPSTGFNSRAPRGSYLCLADFTWLQVFLTQSHTLAWGVIIRKNTAVNHNLCGPHARRATLFRNLARRSSYIHVLLLSKSNKQGFIAML